MFNLFPHKISNDHEAVSSLVLGRASAAFYAATATYFFLEDCHERTLVEAMAPLTPKVGSRQPLVRTILPEV